MNLVMKTVAVVVTEMVDSTSLDALTSFRGESLLLHAVRGLFDSQCVDLVVVIAPVQRVSDFRAVLDSAVLDATTEKSVVVIPGGEDRISSLRKAFDALPLEFSTPENSDIVILMHDVAHAFAPPELIHSVTRTVRQGFPRVVPVLPVTDTIKHIDSRGILTNAVERTLLRSVQTPQGFSLAAFRSALAIESDTLTTFATQMIPGHPLALQITNSTDLIAVEAILAHR